MAEVAKLAAEALRPLTLRRLPGRGGLSPDDPSRLGALAYGDEANTPAGADPCFDVPAPVLHSASSRIDAWTSPGPFVDGQRSTLRWRHNGTWLFGAVDLPEEHGAGLEALGHRAYQQLFGLLRETGFTDIQRLWNYLPHINAEAAGLERYRQFNVGRQRAFLEDGRDVHAGLPAACALGTRDDRLRVCVLAGRRPAVPVENPRQMSAFRYPPAYGPKAPSFSRAALVEAGGGRIGLLISGTASIVDHASVHVGDVTAQARETLLNLQAVIDAAHASTTARFALADLDCTVYVRHATDLCAVRAVLVQAIGEPRTARAICLQADICRSELLVEIEAHAFAPGRLLP